MEVLRCVQCKGEIELQNNGLVGTCLSCGTVYYFKNEKNPTVISLLNQANISRLRGDYDGAILAYQIALKEDETDSDAYWGITLSTYGVEYVEDKTGKFIPTCRRTIKHSILTDENYLNAIKHASTLQAEKITRQANEIDELQTSIKEKIKEEDDYDVFLSFKSTDENNAPTQDRFIARNIYDELTKRGIKTFFAEISLKDRLGKDYEPIIYKALYTCKIFILIATNAEYIQSSWVKNEWSRFRDRANDEAMENVSFAVFSNIKQSDLPPIFRHQGVDLAKYPAGGYEIEIADNLEKRLKQKKFSSLENYEDVLKQKTNIELKDSLVDFVEKKIATIRQTFDEKIDRALAYYEIGNKTKALEIFDEIIDEYPRKAKGWFYKAKIVTENFKTNPVEFFEDAEKVEDFEFLLNNAYLFSSEEEKDLFDKESKEFVNELSLLKNFDKKANEVNENIIEYQKKLFENENVIQKLKDSQNSNVNSLEIMAKDNNLQIKTLRRRLANKTYYIKNIIPTPSVFYSLFCTVGFIIILVAIVGGMIGIRQALLGGNNLSGVFFEMTILLIGGIIPFVFVEILKRQNKLKKVSNILAEETKKLQFLVAENKDIKKQIESFNQIKTKSRNEQKEVLEKNEKLLSSLKEKISTLLKDIKDLIDNNQFLKEHILKYEAKTSNDLLEKQKEINKNLNFLIEEKNNIQKQNERNRNEIINNSPKYFSSNFESLKKKVELLLCKNEKRLVDIDKTMQELKNEQNIIENQKSKNFTNNKIFESFLQEYDIINIDNNASLDLTNENQDEKRS